MLDVRGLQYDLAEPLGGPLRPCLRQRRLCRLHGEQPVRGRSGVRPRHLWYLRQ